MLFLLKRNAFTTELSKQYWWMYIGINNSRCPTEEISSYKFCTSEYRSILWYLFFTVNSVAHDISWSKRGVEPFLNFQTGSSSARLPPALINQVEQTLLNIIRTTRAMYAWLTLISHRCSHLKHEETCTHTSTTKLQRFVCDHCDKLMKWFPTFASNKEFACRPRRDFRKPVVVILHRWRQPGAVDARATQRADIGRDGFVSSSAVESGAWQGTCHGRGHHVRIHPVAQSVCVQPRAQ